MAAPDGRCGKVYSDPRLLRNVLRHAALSQRPDGNLLGTFPTDRGPEDCHYIIEDYNCQWVEGLRTYFEATGDHGFVREMWGCLTRLMDWFIPQHTPRGLILAREYTSFDNPLANIRCEGATINAFLHQSLRDADSLARAIGETQSASRYGQSAGELHAAFNEHLWDESGQAYSAGFRDGERLGPTVHAQLMALHCGLVPPEREPATRAWFLNNYRNPSEKHCGHNPDSARMIADRAGLGMPLMYYWASTELYRMDCAAMDREVINEMRRCWTHMVQLQQDAGTLSESFVDEHSKGSSESCDG
jgi:alpha-L-rhamnosidase